MSEMIQKLKLFVQGRAISYRLTFGKTNIHAQDVLKDLAKFCRAHETTFNPDPRVHAVLEGRREVFLRIMNHLELDVEALYKIHKIYEE